MLAPDTILQNRYRILGPLGSGGMGTVYEARALRLNTTVAVKETHFTDERLRKQFEREAQLLAGLRHPVLPRVIDHFDEGEGLYLVMDFIAGDDLGALLEKRGGAFPLNDVLLWADQLLDALDYLHSQDPPVIHRDIKPQNLKLTAKNQIVLLDFGLAKGFAGQISRVTASGSIFGYTPNYAPLEQIQGTGTDARSDLYALAATVYHLLTKVAPPDVLARLGATANSQQDPLRAAHELNTQVPASVGEVLRKGMAIGNSQRYPTAAEMRKALKSASQPETLKETQLATPQPISHELLPTRIVEEERAQEIPPTIASPALHRSEERDLTIKAPYEPARSFESPQLSSWPAQPAQKSKPFTWFLVALGLAMLVVISIFLVTKFSDTSGVSDASSNTSEPTRPSNTSFAISNTSSGNYNSTPDRFNPYTGSLDDLMPKTAGSFTVNENRDYYGGLNYRYDLHGKDWKPRVYEDNNRNHIEIEIISFNQAEDARAALSKLKDALSSASFTAVESSGDRVVMDGDYKKVNSNMTGTRLMSRMVFWTKGSLLFAVTGNSETAEEFERSYPYSH